MLHEYVDLNHCYFSHFSFFSDICIEKIGSTIIQEPRKNRYMYRLLQRLECVHTCASVYWGEGRKLYSTVDVFNFFLGGSPEGFSLGLALGLGLNLD